MAKTITGTYASGITLTDGDDPVTVLATGTITPASGIALYGPGGGSTSWTIDNAGLISGGPNDVGVALGSFGTTVTPGVVINEATGSISGGSASAAASIRIFGQARSPIAVQSPAGFTGPSISKAGARSPTLVLRPRFRAPAMACWSIAMPER